MVNTTNAKFRNVNTRLVAREGSPSDQQGLLSGDKLLAVAELLIRSNAPLSARAIADALAINRTTTHRSLNTLINRGWVERRAGASDYQLSMRFWALAHVSTQGRSFLQDIRPALEHLSQRSRETIHVGVLDGFEVLHIDKIDSLERVGVSSKIGSRGPAHTASLGKALLAASPDALIEEYIAHSHTIQGEDALGDPNAFRAGLALTRERGYSIDNEEDAIGVRCLGVAIVGAGNAPLFAISITGPAARFTDERLRQFAPEMLAVARELSLQFGGATGREQAGNPG
jgi:IclR family KDG regulon transcriptional repressor